jgi:hypothetical protein
LFEALTGRHPFEGTTSFQILADKQQLPAPRASSLVADLPSELDELCAELLQRSPEQRAGAARVLAALGATDVEEAEAALSPGGPLPVSFTGRDAELVQLQRALTRTNQGAFKVMLVEGESGVGKSELVAEFVRRAQAADTTLLSLYGRCYENEQVSYKAFDGCVDELSASCGVCPKRSARSSCPRARLCSASSFRCCARSTRSQKPHAGRRLQTLRHDVWRLSRR